MFQRVSLIQTAGPEGFIFGVHGELFNVTFSSERQYFSSHSFAVIGAHKSRFSQETVL